MPVSSMTDYLWKLRDPAQFFGFQWFNRHFDVEKKPLQSIGLVELCAGISAFCGNINVLLLEDQHRERSTISLALGGWLS